MSEHPILDWDPRDVSVLRDQRRAYDELRERCPVAHDSFLGWSLFRQHDIVSVLADPETFSNASEYRSVPNGMDPPDHTRYRRALEPYFRPERMHALEPRCRRIAVDLLRACPKRDEVEFIAEFAQPFPVKTHCAFSGWSPETWTNLRDWARRNQAAALSPNQETGTALAREFAGYVSDALRVRRKTGIAVSDDVITSLLGTAVEGTALSDEDIVSILRNWTASCATMAAALGILVFHLATHPDMQERLRREPSLLAAAIEEILRTDGPLVANHRTATREVEIADRRIGAGEQLSLNWIAANRDGGAIDDPVAVHLDRDHGDNLLFGAGIHYCQGAPFARLQLRVAMEELLRCTTTIELGASEPPRRDVYPSNGFLTMPVCLRAS
ncbi:MAG: cytochrome P450 [Actinomycetota bacterium]|nr:cytochrome P450 [Actinomycetota bacterium]